MRLTLGHENSYDALMPECRQALPVAEYLAEAEPELSFLVVGGDALDFRHEDGLVLLPCQVEVRFWRQAGARFDSGVAEYAGELVLGIAVSSKAPFDHLRIDAERLSASGQSGCLCLTVGARRGLWSAGFFFFFSRPSGLS